MRYRYRTIVLLGAWKESAEEACDDAIRAKQAIREDDGTITWRVSGSLEAAGGHEAAHRVA